MNRNNFRSVVNQTLLWLLMFPSLCMGANVLHICETDGDTAEAGFEGSIISPSRKYGYLLYCSLRLSGVPDRSWFGLYVETLTLPCTSLYCYYSGGYRQCNPTKSYIKIDNVNKRICEPSETSNLYYYKDTAGSVTVRLYSDYYYTAIYSFNLTYKVASVIDTGEGRTHHEVDTVGQQSGYVVSHSAYGNENYRKSINSYITLTNLGTNSIEIYLFELDLWSYNCIERLVIHALNTSIICGRQTSEYVKRWKKFKTINNMVKFQFVSDSSSYRTEAGFMFQYKVLEPETSSSPVVPPTTHKSTVRTTASTQIHQSTKITEPIGMTTSDKMPASVEATRESSATTENHISKLFSTVLSSTIDPGTPGPSSTHKSTFVTPESTQEIQITEERLAQTSLNQAVTTPSPGGSTLYIGVGVGSGVLLAVLAAVIVIVLMKRRNTKTKRENQMQHENGSRMGNLEVINAANDTYELPEVDGVEADGVYYSAATVVEDSESSPRDEAEVSFTVHNVDRQTMNQETDFSSDTHNTYDSVEGGDSTVPSSAEKSTSKESADVEAVPAADEDNIYQLADEIDDNYANAAAMRRLEEERDIPDTYSSITAATKPKKEETEMVENDLYGT